eukprot:TRINITY_DN106_c0_g1_i2.p1 TRINITY_DN106_c0_g1~~TRINITY_DN106_c0_g1_i2.p1  ORF type:complete len:112 (-),score=34.66 TRINITY_DN106_c0_g1_i2:157-492(-)
MCIRDSLNVVSISENADVKVWAGDVGQLDGPSETLVLVGVVVLEDGLELDGLQKLPLLVLGALEDGGDHFADTIVRELAHGILVGQTLFSFPPYSALILSLIHISEPTRPY